MGFAQGRWQKGSIRIDDGEMKFKNFFLGKKRLTGNKML
jgi:hypothetical protein